jgi:cytochrome b subunit of formate dehydrogenase
VEIVVKLIVLGYSVYLLWSYVTGLTMWAPYHTLPHTPENRVSRACHALAALVISLAACYWLAKDFLE